MYAACLHLRAAQPHVNKGKLQNVFREVYKTTISHLGNKGCLGVNKLSYLRKLFKISPAVARGKLSKAFRLLVYLGDSVCLDEKMKKWRGRSPYIKKVLAKKNDPVGHWTTQLCANLNSTNTPIIIGLYPFAGKLDNNHPLETRSDIWEWVLQLLQLGKREKVLPVICADSFYLDNTARNMLLDNNVIYHCSVKKTWFTSISSHLEGKTKDMGTWAAMENTV